jgi:hypothetical protein
MRFPQLPIGARFEYQGKAYSKTSALLASAEDGSGQRIIPKYADLTPAQGDAAAAVAAPPPTAVDWVAVAAAFADHHAACQDLLRLVGTDPAGLDSALASLDKARQRFLDRLGNASG